MEQEKVNHPLHYAGKAECIDVMIQQFGIEQTKSFCILNSFKYLWRSQKKNDSPIEDVQKAKWYIDKYLELCQK